MAYAFKIKTLASEHPIYWFSVKDRYLVRIDAEHDAGYCECMAWSLGKECKHTQQCRKLVRLMKNGAKQVQE